MLSFCHRVVSIRALKIQTVILLFFSYSLVDVNSTRLPVTLDLLGEEVTVTVFGDPPQSPPSPDFEAMPPPPRAPLRRRRIRRQVPYWRNLRHQIRRRFLAYTPEDIAEIDDPRTLEKIFKMYFFKSAKPSNMPEWLYCSAMMDSLCRKLR